ncbi:flavodoxin family protein [Salinarimonas ramus]|uniref:Flavodoxin-like domain-containing protein n=1 Tax=Salinarimonas ramus TaxID=690164 RepID=A0A917Q5B7_9HYPH|nr:flavodoxin [Salinarimonas ramus]GGK25516.1 hypothetical protein GCM10011322_10100 [Salinarimonas ramus]
MAGILVAYHSRTGHTRRAAERFAALVGADLTEIRPRAPERYRGAIGLVRAAWGARRARPCAIEPMEAPIERYELVVVATPIWAGHVTPPVRAFLKANRDRLADYATLYTHGGGQSEAGEDMARLCDRSPRAVVDLRNREEGTPAYDDKLAAFVRELAVAPPG